MKDTNPRRVLEERQSVDHFRTLLRHANRIEARLRSDKRRTLAEWRFILIQVAESFAPHIGAGSGVGRRQTEEVQA